MGLPPGVGALVAKELRQVTRSRGAMASTIVLPILMLVVMPLGQLLPVRSIGETRMPTMNGLPPGLAEMDDPTQILVQAMFPLFVMLAGLMVPSVGATHTIVVERERRSLELLMALPVSVGTILTSKLLAIFAMSCAAVLPLFALDAVVLLTLGIAESVWVALLLLELLAALWCALGVSLLLALLARDFRTANNLNGAMLGPMVLVALGVLFGVPGLLRVVVLVGALVLAGSVAVAIGLWWLTFERYLA